jgi:hypothetical protein
VYDGPDAGLITQKGIVSLGNTITKVNGRSRSHMQGVYTVPKGVHDLQLGIWQIVQPHNRMAIVVDSADLTPIRSDGSAVQKPGLGRGIARYVAPTYFPADFGDVMRLEEHYRHFIDVQENLTTNSVFGPMYLTLGNVAFPFIALIAFLAAILAGHASRYRSYFLLTLVVIGYCFAEFWRTYLFNFGIIHFLLIALVGVPLFDGLVFWLRRQAQGWSRAR